YRGTQKRARPPRKIRRASCRDEPCAVSDACVPPPVDLHRLVQQGVARLTGIVGGGVEGPLLLREGAELLPEALEARFDLRVALREGREQLALELRHRLRFGPARVRAGLGQPAGLGGDVRPL